MKNEDSKDMLLSELFDRVRVEKGANAVPVTVQQAPGDTRLMILIQGEADLANLIMAQLMTAVQDLHDMAEQQEVAAPVPTTEDHSDEPRILV